MVTNVTVDNVTYAITLDVNGSIIGNLNELNDVTIATPLNTQGLIYNSTTSKWENGTLAGSGDMLKSVYDIAGNGIVDNAEALGTSSLAEVLAAGGSVTSVNSATGVVVLDADDLSDTSTANKFATAAELSAIATNTSKISYSTAASDAVALNTAKTGITSGQASAITTNTAKVTYDDAVAVGLNTAKVSFDSTSSTRLANTSGTNTGDQVLPTDFDPAGTDNSDNNAVNTLYSGLDAAKQDDITLTTTGTSGAATLTGATLNIPQYTAGGGGDVSKVGTPLDNQVGVWTGDGTIEGTTGLTYDGTTLDLTGNIHVGTDNTYQIGINTKRYNYIYSYNMVVDTSIIHNGDLDTRIDFNTNEIELVAGGANALVAKSTGVDVTGDIVVTGTVDGVDIAAEETRLANTSGTNTGDNATNSQYSSLVSNVSTNLSEGTNTTTTVDVNSSDGTNATLVSASTSRAGLLTKAKFDEIVVNSAHSADNTQAHSDYLVNNASDTTSGTITAGGFTTTGVTVTGDHGTGTTDQVVNVCYGTSATPPTASTTTEGAVYIQYTA